MIETANKSADDSFLAFLASNPHVYPDFCRFAREIKTAMFRNGKRPVVSAKAVWERCRYESVVRTDGIDYAWNNNHVSRMARYVMQREPDLAGCFETRRLKTAPGTLALRY